MIGVGGGTGRAGAGVSSEGAAEGGGGVVSSSAMFVVSVSLTYWLRTQTEEYEESFS